MAAHDRNENRGAVRGADPHDTQTTRSFRLHGVVVPLVTPLDHDERPDLKAFPRLVDHVVGGGAHAIFSLGTTGEYPRLDRRDRYRAAEATVSAARGRVPVLVGVTDTGTRRAVENAKAATSIGADAIVASLPFYFPAVDDREVVAYFSAIADATDLPLVLYNIPGTSGAALSLAAFRQLIADRRIVAIKDSSGSLDVLRDLVAAARSRPGFPVFVGEERISLDGLIEGAEGLVPSLGNPFPRLYVDLYESFRAGKLDRARELMEAARAINVVHLYSGSWLSAIASRKIALSLMGICGETVTAPFVPVDEPTRRKIALTVERYASLA